ncbi:MAG: SH3 domain-containing protein [Thermodesulfobacteriota bacterium]
MSPQTKAFLRCSVVGALLGGILGALTGALIGKGAKEAAIGGAIGGAAGAAIGAGACFIIASENKEIADYQTTKKQTNYQPSQGDMIKITEFSLSPDAVRPGEEVTFSCQYRVMTPNPNVDIAVTETRTVKIYDRASGLYKELGHSRDQITMRPGTRRSDGAITVYASTPEGQYVIALAVGLNGNRVESEQPLTIAKQAASVPYQEPKGRKEAISSESLSPTGKIKQYFVVTANTANLRSGPGTNFQVVNQLRKGERYPILEAIQNPGESHSWYRIRLDDGRESWVNGIGGKVVE